MTIARIERLRSRLPRYRVRCDNGESVILSEDLLIRFGLAAGDELTEGQIQNMRDSSEADDAKQKAYHYISYRPRSEHEISQYLRRKGFSRERAHRTIEDFRSLGLVDDESFAAMIVRDAVARGKSGPAAVRKKLLEKRIARQTIDTLIAEHFTDDLLESKAIALLKKRVERTRARLKGLDPSKRRARLYQYLCQRGFSSQTAKHALNSIEV